MGFPILVRRHLFIESGPCCLLSQFSWSPQSPWIINYLSLHNLTDTLKCIFIDEIFFVIYMFFCLWWMMCIFIPGGGSVGLSALLSDHLPWPQVWECSGVVHASATWWRPIPGCLGKEMFTSSSMLTQCNCSISNLLLQWNPVISRAVNSRKLVSRGRTLDPKF